MLSCLSYLTQHTILTPAQQITKPMFEATGNMFTSAASRSLKIIQKTLIHMSIIMGVIISSITIYFILYMLIIPKGYQKIPLRLYPTVDSKEGHVAVGEDLWIEYESYDISILLTLPESEQNYDIGNFDVNVQIGKKTTLRGMGILKYRSPIIRFVRQVFFVFPTMIGLMEESQDIKIALPSYSVKERNISELSIAISPKPLQIYDAYLQMEVKFSGLRYFMYHNPYSTATIVILSLAICQAAIIYTLLYFYFYQDTSPMKKQRKKVLNSKRPQHWILPVPEGESYKKSHDFSKIIRIHNTKKLT